MGQKLDPALLEFCQTKRQEETLTAIIEEKSWRGAANKLGINHRTLASTVKRVKEHAAEQGYCPHAGVERKTLPGFGLKRISTLARNSFGEPQWQIQEKKAEDQKREMQAIAQAFAEDVPKIAAVPPPEENHEELMSVYPMGDPHFGLYCWAAEVGNDFDLEIAERDLYAAVDYLVDRSPPSKRAVLLNLGDLFHAENMEGVTTKSGNVLDIDTRFPMMIDVGVRTLRRCIHRMLEKHENVEVINTPGNHDETMAFFMSILLGNVYENEPRLHIHREPTQRFYVEHGRCLIGSVHGHRTKDASLPGIMATEMPEAWGRTRHRVWYRGHHHQDRLEEFNGCVVKQCRTLAPGDAYAVGNGYLSGQDMKCDVYHSQYGLQTSFTCGIDVLRGNL